MHTQHRPAAAGQRRRLSCRLARAPCLIVLLLLAISARLVALSLVEAHATPDGPGWPSGWQPVLPCVPARTHDLVLSEPLACCPPTTLIPADSWSTVTSSRQPKQAAQIKLCTRKWHAAYSAFRRELLSLVRLLGPSPVCRETSPRD
jgi:hypothetical protein